MDINEEDVFDIETDIPEEDCECGECDICLNQEDCTCGDCEVCLADNGDLEEDLFDDIDSEI